MNRIELLAPAGDPEKLKIALCYGADAVYFGGEDFSLRSASDNFSEEDMRECVEFAHGMGRKCYLTLNIYAHNGDISKIRDYLERIKDIPLDAFLVSDPGVMDVLKEVIPDAVIHLSTQANMTNYAAAEFWKKQGVSRAVLARELTLEEIKERCPELKYFEVSMPEYPGDKRDGTYYKIPAGWLIDQCGLKGMNMGKAGVWHNQALILYNRGGAQGNEIVALMKYVQAAVKEKFGIELKPEVNVI